MDQVTHCIAKEDEIRSIEVLEVPIYGNKTERKSSHWESDQKCRDCYIVTIRINRDWMIQCQYWADILGAFSSYHSTNEQHGQYSVKKITTSLSLCRNSQ